MKMNKLSVKSQAKLIIKLIAILIKWKFLADLNIFLVADTLMGWMKYPVSSACYLITRKLSWIQAAKYKTKLNNL